MRVNSPTPGTEHTTSSDAKSLGRSKHQHLAPSSFVVPARYVLLRLAEAVTGYTVKAMERKIERGDWTEGKVWRRAPDGHIVIDLQGYQRWVENQF